MLHCANIPRFTRPPADGHSSCYPFGCRGSCLPPQACVRVRARRLRSRTCRRTFAHLPPYVFAHQPPRACARRWRSHTCFHVLWVYTRQWNSAIERRFCVLLVKDPPNRLAQRPRHFTPQRCVLASARESPSAYAAALAGVKWDLTAASIYIPLMNNDTEHRFPCLWSQACHLWNNVYSSLPTFLFVCFVLRCFAYSTWSS